MDIDKRVQNQPSCSYRDSEGRSKIELLVESYVHSVIKLRHTPSRRRLSGNLIMAPRPMKLRGTTTRILSEDSYYVVSPFSHHLLHETAFSIRDSVTRFD